MTVEETSLHIFIVATEESGDRLGAPLMRAISAKAGRPVKFSGVGGAAMTAEGLASLFPISQLAIVGIDEVLKKLPTILQLIRTTTSAVVSAKPDLLLIIDSPDFTHRVARKVRAALPDLPIVDYVSPSVWAWRPGRARKMRAYVDHLMALLPFEPDAHRALGGPPCTYVGHPLVEVPVLLPPNSQEQARRDASPPLLLVLPGSRNSEVARLAAVFGETARRVAERCGPLEIIVPTVPHVEARVRDAVGKWGVPASVVLDPTEKGIAFRNARAALAASGTVTLELAMAAIPTVVGYKVSPLEAVIAHAFIRGNSVVLPNLVLGENVIPELLQSRLTPESAAAALAPLIRETPARHRQVAAFGRLNSIMRAGTLTPSDHAADIVLAVADKRRPSGMSGAAATT